MSQYLSTVSHLNATHIAGVQNITDVATEHDVLYATKCRHGKFDDVLCQTNWVISLINIIAGVAVCENDVITPDPENCFAFMNPDVAKIAKIWTLCDGRTKCEHAKSKSVKVIDCNSTASFIILQYLCVERYWNLSDISPTTANQSLVTTATTIVNNSIGNYNTTAPSADYTEDNTYGTDLMTSYDPVLSTTTPGVQVEPLFTTVETALIIGIPLTVLVSFAVFVCVSRKFRNRFKFRVNADKDREI